MLWGRRIHDLQGAFEAMDRDGDGLLSKQELKAALKRLGMGISEGQVRQHPPEDLRGGAAAACRARSTLRLSHRTLAPLCVSCCPLHRVHPTALSLPSLVLLRSLSLSLPLSLSLSHALSLALSRALALRLGSASCELSPSCCLRPVAAIKPL